MLCIHSSFQLIIFLQTQLRQVQNSLSLASHHHMILTLLNAQDSTKPFVMLEAADIQTEDDLLEFCTRTEKLGVVHAIQSNRLILAYYFKRYDVAADMADLYHSRKMMRFLDLYVVLFDGLTSLKLARRKNGDKEKWIRKSEQAISSFKTWGSHSNWNCENKLLLLQAEMHSVRGQVDDAEEKYKVSILSARKHRFIQEEGMALELLGEFYKENERHEDARVQLIAARDCYEQWGATVLVNLLKPDCD